MAQIPAAKAGDVVLEIVHDETGEIGHRSVVTGMSERQIDRREDGMNINLDHDNWSTRVRTLDADEPAGAENGR